MMGCLDADSSTNSSCLLKESKPENMEHDSLLFICQLRDTSFQMLILASKCTNGNNSF